MSDKITFFRSYAEALDDIEDAEEYRACMQALLRYAFTGEEDASTPTAKMYLRLVKPTLDKSIRFREAGQNGGSHGKAIAKPDASLTQASAKPLQSLSEASAKPTASHSEAYEKPSGSLSEADIGVRNKDKGVRNKDIGVGEGDRGMGEEPEKRKRFTPPTVEEVAAYCREKGYTISPDRFIDFYQSVGWKVGNKSMQDWKAAVRTWQSRERQKPKNNSDELDAFMLDIINGGNNEQTGDNESNFFNQGNVPATF